MSIDRFYLGAMHLPRPDWEAFHEMPEATQSTKPESVANEIARKREKQAEKIWQSPLGGYVSELCVLRDDQPFFTGKADFQQSGAMAVAFIIAVNAAGPDVLGFTPEAPNDCGVRWFGCDIRYAMRQLVMAARRENATLPIPPALWYHRNFMPAPFLDPYEAAVPSELRDGKGVTLGSLWSFTQVPMTPEINTDSAAGLAALARALTLHLHLVPS